MDRQQIGLKLALDALGKELSLDDFNDRLALQKTIYLIQAGGVHLGYDYGWYLRGPYSRGLTRDAFAVRAHGPEEVKGWKLDPQSLTRLASLREAFASWSVGRCERHLELLASVHFILETRQGRADDLAGLRQTLSKSNKDFSEADIGQAIEDLKRHDLFPSP